MRPRKQQAEANYQVLDLFPKASSCTQMVPLALIDPEPQPWRVRRAIDPEQLTSLQDAVATTGELEPLRLMVHGERLHIVSGEMRYHVAIRRRSQGGPDVVAARVVPAAPPEEALRWTILEGEIRSAYTQLELGWALTRLRGLLQERRGKHVPQTALIAYIGVNQESWKTRVSEAIKAADVLPEEEAPELAAQHGCDFHALVAQPRAVWREVKKASPEGRDVLKHLLGESLAAQKNPASDLRRWRQLLDEPETLNLATAAMDEGRSLVELLSKPEPSVALVVVEPTSASAWGRLLAWARAAIADLAGRAARALSKAQARLQAPAGLHCE
jgi:hypothetical protein